MAWRQLFMFFPNSRNALPMISRWLMLPLIPHWHGYKAPAPLSISPPPIPPKAPPGRRIFSPDPNPSAAVDRRFLVLRWAIAPLACIVHSPVSRCVSWPRACLRACTAERTRRFSDEPEPWQQLRRPIPAGPRRASTSCLLQLLRRAQIGRASCRERVCLYV